ncbi:MAG: DUF5694 domain-containing protein [Xanthomonadales bacterium]|nr:DUF5694 domain-containing protein [Xanthomonadales bacterium]
MQRLNAFLVILLTATMASAAVHARDVQVMVLGTYHLANPGQDLHNVEVDDVTAQARQEELEAVADVLAAFAPDRIAVEAVSEREDFSLEAYETFKIEDLGKVPNEREQIGYRLAHRMGHEHVYGIDEQDEEVDYFPYGTVLEFAERDGRSEQLEDLNRRAAVHVETIGRLHAKAGIGHALHWINQPAIIQRSQSDFYYGLLGYADENDQPGALLNARYYERNARIFAKLIQVVEPGDRVLVVYGSGHSYWLRHFVSGTPGFELVEPNDYLSALVGR